MLDAIRFDRLGGPDVRGFADVAAREPGTGEVLLKVAVVGLNRADSMYYHGAYSEQPNLPSGLGNEAIGTVAAGGAGTDVSLVGRRLATIPGYSINRYPVLAEQAVVPADVLAPVPDAFTDPEGAAVWMAYPTACGATVVQGRVSAGDVVIITATSSSVGLAAIETDDIPNRAR